MRERTAERVTGDCLNAVFQGYFHRETLHEEQLLDGLGIAIDDEFNFMLSHWRASMINGDSFLKTAAGHVLYGSFQQNLPVGMVAVLRDDLKIFLIRSSLKRGGVEWARDVAVIDTRSNIFYVIQLSKKDDQESTIGPITNSESSRYDRVKVQWKIKIVERCALRQDGTLAATSKLPKRFDKRIQFFKADFTIREQNEVALLASILGNAFTEASFVSPRLFLKKMAVSNPKINTQHIQQRNQDQETLLIDIAGSKVNEKKLGLTFSLTYDYIKSLGSYNQEGKLHGLGVQYRKAGQSLVGLFKDNLLTKQYKHNQAGSKNVSTFTTRELALQQHLRSLNYVHNTIYLPEISNITGIAAKISKYIQAFEREYEKRNANYNETPSSQSFSSQALNIYKYIDNQRQKQEELRSSRNVILAQSSDTIKKPGFILHKSRSIDKSPQNNRKSPPTAQKSPLRNVRITGKIYHQTQRKVNERSPYKHTTRLKLNEDTYRHDKYY